ncbi:MAG: tRNA uridine-5-carboxymethylaminomethyl(34) synthesis GTPase MnmE [Paracoccaceae bacterium]
MTHTDTIYAPATGMTGAAIAVLRISGPKAGYVLEAITGKPLPAPRFAALRQLLDADRAMLDEALVLWFPEGASYTGEPMVEIQCHGGRAVLQAVMKRIADFDGVRLADPGEFTKRAVLAGRMDLVEAEGLGDLVAAETDAQRRQAQRQMSGEVSAQLESWRSDLIRARALIEATIDWADEEVPEDVSPEVGALLSGVVAGLQSALGTTRKGRELRDGFEVALIGPPNVGKSSLLNVLAGRDAAIVSATPGTTRDVIELRYDLDGLPVVFLDTAGLRETADGIEAEGIRRTETRARSAALRLHLVSADINACAGTEFWQEGDVSVCTKVDLAEIHADLSVSAETGQGISTLLSEIGSRLKGRISEAALLVSERQEIAAGDCLDACNRAVSFVAATPVEMVAEELRSAIHALDRLTGQRDVEDILGVVFGEFCLGK